MALIASQTPSITGLTPTYTLVSASDTVRFNTGSGKVFLICKNTSGSPNTVTVVVPGSTFGQPNPDVAVTVVATTGEKWIGPLDKRLAVSGAVTVTNSAPASGVVMAVVEL